MKRIQVITNFTLSDKLEPIVGKQKGYLDVRNFGKVQGKKQTVHFFTWRVYGEFT
jgi:hypothetical protein